MTSWCTSTGRSARCGMSVVLRTWFGVWAEARAEARHVKPDNDLTNLEDDNVAHVERGMYSTGCKDTVANVIDIDKIIHDLPHTEDDSL